MACDHCNGVIEKQMISADGEPYYFYECQGCSCQWDTNGYRMTIGNREACENEWVALEFKLQNRLPTISRKTWLLIGIVVALALLPFTGSLLLAMTIRLLVIVRLFIVPITIMVIAYIMYRRWKKHQK
ncbi:MAG: hypothetical protein M9918_21955 [Anaerolineae bacterium]|nr:hypothetical protein [Anaerolineae bacterium]